MRSTVCCPGSALMHLPACQLQAPVLMNRYGYRLVPRSWELLPRPQSMEQVHAAHRFTSVLALMLTWCVALVIGGMLAWHTYLVLSAQGTIDFQKNRMAAYYVRPSRFHLPSSTRC